MSVSVNGEVLDGPEDSVLDELASMVRDEDPDVIYTEKGDSFVMPYLQHRASLHGMKLELGREEGERTSRGKSYFTYGRIVYKPPAYKLRGRVHIDREASFIYGESGLPGLIEMSRLSHAPCRMSLGCPRGVISAMQVNEAVRGGHLIRWKKNRQGLQDRRGPHSLRSRRFIYEPASECMTMCGARFLLPVSQHHGEVQHLAGDLNCTCSPLSRIVPEIGYRVCEKRRAHPHGAGADTQSPQGVQEHEA